MRKKSMFLWSLLAAMAMSACSEHNELPSGEVPGGNSKTNFIVKLNFEGTSMEQGVRRELRNLLQCRKHRGVKSVRCRFCCMTQAISCGFQM